MDYTNWFKTIYNYAQNPKDIEEQIKSLRQIEQWLYLNISMVRNSIQFLEIYKNAADISKIYPNFNNFFNAMNSFMPTNTNNSINGIEHQNHYSEFNIKDIQENTKNLFAEFENLMHISQDYLKNMQSWQQTWGTQNSNYATNSNSTSNNQK